MKQIIEYLPIIIFTITYFYSRDIFFATLILVPGLILANGPTVQLSPIVAPKTIVFGFIKTFFPILHLSYFFS